MDGGADGGCLNTRRSTASDISFRSTRQRSRNIHLVAGCHARHVGRELGPLHGDCLLISTIRSHCGLFDPSMLPLSATTQMQILEWNRAGSHKLSLQGAARAWSWEEQPPVVPAHDGIFRDCRSKVKQPQHDIMAPMSRMYLAQTQQGGAGLSGQSNSSVGSRAVRSAAWQR